jgi:hypothetical protein
LSSISFWLSHQNPIRLPLILMRATCPTHLILCVVIILILLCEVYKLRNSLLCNLKVSLVHF